MPMFEFECRKCHATFEELLRSSSDRNPACPKCSSRKVDRLFSAFAMGKSSSASGSGSGSGSGSSCSCGSCRSHSCSTCGH